MMRERKSPSPTARIMATATRTPMVIMVWLAWVVLCSAVSAAEVSLISIIRR